MSISELSSKCGREQKELSWRQIKEGGKSESGLRQKEQGPELQEML